MERVKLDSLNGHDEARRFEGRVNRQANRVDKLTREIYRLALRRELEALGYSGRRASVLIKALETIRRVTGRFGCSELDSAEASARKVSGLDS